MAWNLVAVSLEQLQQNLRKHELNAYTHTHEAVYLKKIVPHFPLEFSFFVPLFPKITPFHSIFNGDVQEYYHVWSYMEFKKSEHELEMLSYARGGRVMQTWQSLFWSHTPIRYNYF